MGTLEKQTLAWAETAPVQLSGHATSSAPPEAVWAILADHLAWTEWFPNVTKVEVTGPAEGVGARRRVSIPGATVDEEFIAWEPGSLFAFTGTAAKPKVFRSLVEHCRLSPTASGGTDITYTMCLAPAGPLGALLKLSSGRIRKSIQQGTEHLARRAEAAG